MVEVKNGQWCWKTGVVVVVVHSLGLSFND